MEVKVILLLGCCCLLLINPQQYPIMADGKTNINDTSTSEVTSTNNNTIIPIGESKLEVLSSKQTSERTEKNKGESILAAAVNAALNNNAGNNSSEKLSRKVTPTANHINNTASVMYFKNNSSTANSTSSDVSIRTIESGVVAENLNINMLKSTTDNFKKFVNPPLLSANNTQSNITANSTKNAVSHEIIGQQTTTNIGTDIKKLNESEVIPTATSNVTLKSSSAKTTTTSTNISATTNATTTTTTTTTTTPKPSKPVITFGLGDYPQLPSELNLKNSLPQSENSKLPIPPDSPPLTNEPNAQPSQELKSGGTYRSSRDYIIPIMTIFFTIPLAIGVIITTYRRFRDCWTTRHYRRMDFLVDGMYND